MSIFSTPRVQFPLPQNIQRNEQTNSEEVTFLLRLFSGTPLSSKKSPRSTTKACQVPGPLAQPAWPISLPEPGTGSNALAFPHA